MTRKQLTISLASLLAERAVMKRRSHDISVKLKRIRAALARLPDAGDLPAPEPDVTPQGNIFDDLDDFLNNL
jgi:hypothetical protein